MAYTTLDQPEASPVSGNEDQRKVKVYTYPKKVILR